MTPKRTPVETPSVTTRRITKVQPPPDGRSRLSTAAVTTEAPRGTTNAVAQRSFDKPGRRFQPAFGPSASSWIKGVGPLGRPSDLDRQNLGHPLGDRLQGVCAPRALPPPEDALPALCMVGLSRGPSRVPQSQIKTTLRATQAQQVLNFVPIPTVYVHPIRLNPYTDSDVVVPLGSSRQRKLAFLMGPAK